MAVIQKDSHPRYLDLPTWWCYHNAAMGDTVHSAQLAANATGVKQAVMTIVGDHDACVYIINNVRWGLSEIVEPRQVCKAYPFPWESGLQSVIEATDSEGGEP